MPFGWEERGKQLRYKLSLFSELETTQVDGLGVAAESCVVAQTPEFHRGVETLNIDGIWKEFPETAVPYGVPEDSRILHEERSKLGGWPFWVQNPLRPEDETGEEMEFVAQLDMWTCPDSSWASGGYAYLFASAADLEEQEAELVIQTT